MEVRQNLVRLCEKINDGHYKITPDCAEYRVFEKWMTDDQIAVLLAIKGTMKINTLGSIAKNAGMDRLADKRDEGLSAPQLAAWAEENRLKVNHWFFSTDLTFYVKGGRISKTAGFFGGALNICPLMNMDSLGRLIPRVKARGKKNAMRECLSRMLQLTEGGADYSGKCYISNSNCPDDARALADAVEAAFPKLNGPVEINSIGTTIGSHTGPGTVALFFWGAERKD